MKTKSLLKMLNSCEDDTKLFAIINGVKTEISQVSYEVASDEVIIYPKQNINKQYGTLQGFRRFDNSDELLNYINELRIKYIGYTFAEAQLDRISLLFNTNEFNACAYAIEKMLRSMAKKK